MGWKRKAGLAAEAPDLPVDSIPTLHLGTKYLRQQAGKEDRLTVAPGLRSLFPLPTQSYCFEIGVAQHTMVKICSRGVYSSHGILGSKRVKRGRKG